jgi:hypothetical protein
MDQAPLVDEMKKEGAALIEKLISEGVDVAAACWLKESDGDRWHLYIATSLVSEEGGMKPAYRRIDEVMQKMPPLSSLDFFSIKVVSPKSPVAQAVAETHRRFPDRNAYIGEGAFGRTYVDGGFIYGPWRNGVNAARQ